MASLHIYRRSKTTSAARKDMISQLPDDVKEKILECLPTPDAARTALLSTDWKDVWLRHGRLDFNTHFFKCLRKCEGDKRVALVSTINDILLHRAGQVVGNSIWLEFFSWLIFVSFTVSKINDVAVATQAFPTARNLQVITIYDLNFGRGKQITSALELLQRSPNLCELEIIIETDTLPSGWDDTALRLTRDPDSCFINQDLKMLKTIKIESFSGSMVEMHFVKALLSKSPTLEKIVIQESADIDATMAFKIPRELLSFPRISSKAQLVFMECKPTYSLVAPPWTKKM
ncbi:PREDICTED: uncharacterized protein LOC109182652 [Ipomoea nil]|uniref:uncharacterized protein LOC109182652 n=1 Tax=Ipomoea nil TaxID=35883 RepID=UPI000900D596|nr:PREDICTED: uncharacterized protein LOC109182652 [Ipomoea nil]